MWRLANFDHADFLASYWQQRPLLIRQALPNFQSPVTPEELAGLACEDGVHCRLVIEQGGEKPWQLRYGPFNEEDFTSLPRTHYSLLVSECEKWVPELRSLVDCFDFIPRWRVDDLMISYAPDHGSVGPHIDEYDVFLIQARGRRRWSIERDIRRNPELIPDLDLAIMRDFQPTEEWLLEPGDMLYLPPGIAHHGVAVGDDCMTYSVGFRAPTLGHIMDSLLHEASDHGLTDIRYRDPVLSTDRHPAEISAADLAQFQHLAQQLLAEMTPWWCDVVGKLVSDADLSADIPLLTCASVAEAAAYAWQKHPDARIFFHRSNHWIKLYCNGQSFRLPLSDDSQALAERLGGALMLARNDPAWSATVAHAELLLELVNIGVLIPLDDDR